jgi:hypothetical protein
LTALIRILFLGYLILVLASCAKPKAQKDCGYVQNVYGERVSWKQDVPIHMYLHTSIPFNYVNAITQAAETWNKAYGRQMIIIESTRVGGAAPARDGQNVIYLMSTWEADRTYEQARTSLYWVGDQIQEADIRINAQNYQFYTLSQTDYSNAQAVSLQALITHELGHVIGLRHDDAEPSVMATYLKANEDRDQLLPADVTKLKCEY